MVSVFCFALDFRFVSGFAITLVAFALFVFAAGGFLARVVFGFGSVGVVVTLGAFRAGGTGACCVETGCGWVGMGNGAGDC